ncbi:MAG: ABC transporter substrate-binding protein [Woeseiaceae bacterium]
MKLNIMALALLGTTLTMAGSIRAEESAAADPTVVIESAVDELSEALNGRKLELSENRDELYKVIDRILLPRFDRRYAAQLVLGRYWRTASGCLSCLKIAEHLPRPILKRRSQKRF